MSRPLVVKKSNALINASYTINLAEQRMILLAVATAGGRADAPLRVDAAAYAEQFNVSLNTAYEALRDAASQLFERRFTFQEETGKGVKTTVSRWVSHVSYAEGAGHVELMFSPHVQPLLCELERRFTHYALEQISALTSVHAVRLYELLISWRSTGRTPVIELADFRLRLGIETNEYPRMEAFKRRVLDAAVKQINQHTDITATYEQHKRGRVITGFSFEFTMKTPPVRDPNTVDWVAGTTDAEAGADKPPKRTTISKREAEAMARPGESYSELYARLSREYIIK